MEEDLVGLLLADVGISTVVGNRIWWDVRPQGSARPCIVLFLISGVPDYTMAGASGLVDSTVQMDCQGATKADALAAARALKAKLSGYRGIAGNTKFGGAFVRAERQSFDKGDNDVEGVNLVSIDFGVSTGAAN